ncbi:hypothetical protein EDC04DRAFT_2651080 [Pisolithus marmoratus]|nr:hypothetical protein EDC04DRAFT_2651080 [Pisolithus marmoratus]
MSSRYVFQSPSVTDEKGTYRLRAPRSSRPGSNLRSYTKANYNEPYASPAPLTQHRKLPVFVIFLVVASFTSFATAYYLYKTRWKSEACHGPTIVDNSRSFLVTVLCVFDSVTRSYVDAYILLIATSAPRMRKLGVK